MIRIAITPEAFDAIAATLPLGSVAFEPQLDWQRQRLVWLETAVVDKLAALRGPGESYSDLILRLVEVEAQRRPYIHSSCRRACGRGPESTEPTFVGMD
jgi:hypothetical protein